MQAANDFINQYPDWHDAIRYAIQVASILLGLLIATLFYR